MQLLLLDDWVGYHLRSCDGLAAFQHRIEANQIRQKERRDDEHYIYVRLCLSMLDA